MAAAAKVFVEQEIIGFCLHDVPDADELRMLHRLDLLVEITGPQIDPANHAGDEWMPIRERQQPARFLERLPDLDGDASVDAGPLHLAPPVFRHEVALERRHRGIDPGVLRGGVAPEMHVGVEAEGWCHGRSIGVAPCSLDW